VCKVHDDEHEADSGGNAVCPAGFPVAEVGWEGVPRGAEAVGYVTLSVVLAML
jgi:hypothetical protein